MIANATAAQNHPEPPEVTTSQPPAPAPPYSRPTHVIVRDHRDGVDNRTAVPATPSFMADAPYPNTKEGWLDRIKDNPESGMNAWLDAMIAGNLPEDACSSDFMNVVGMITKEHDRLITMQSNLMSAQHETRKAALQNIRV